MVEAAIDGDPFARTDLFHPFSRNLHYPRTVLVATNLKPGLDTLKLCVADQKDNDRSGHALRIMHFVAN